jgi:hypothetical protein
MFLESHVINIKYDTGKLNVCSKPLTNAERPPKKAKLFAKRRKFENPQPDKYNPVTRT